MFSFTFQTPGRVSPGEICTWPRAAPSALPVCRPPLPLVPPHISVQLLGVAQGSKARGRGSGLPVPHKPTPLLLPPTQREQGFHTRYLWCGSGRQLHTSTPIPTASAQPGPGRGHASFVQAARRGTQLGSSSNLWSRG